MASKLKEKHICPECQEEKKTAIELGKHRRAAHGVESPKAAKARAYYLRKKAKKAGKSGVEAPPDKPKAKQVKALVVIPKEEQIVHEKQSPGIDPIIFALTETVGQVKELCRHIAKEHGFPERLFTRQFAELFRDQARR